MRELDMRGQACPMPVIETKKVLEEGKGQEAVQVLVDNEIAVQNLKKLAAHQGMKAESEKRSDAEFAVTLSPGEGTAPGKAPEQAESESREPEDTGSVIARGRVAVFASDRMGEPEEDLGRILVKGFIYAVSRQDKLPETMIFYNGGAKLTCQDSESLEDLKAMESQGVEIITCGTCLKHLGMEDKLAVGTVSNMYEIAEKMTGAKLIVKP